MRQSLVLVLVLVSSLVCADDGARSHLQQAKDTLKDWTQKFATMRVRSLREATADSNALVREAGITHSITKSDWIWEDSGRFRDNDVLLYDGDVRLRSMRSANLSKYYTTSFQHGEDEFPARVGIQPRSDHLTSLSLRKQPFWFLWDSHSRTWLGQRIQSVHNAELTTDGLLEIRGDDIGSDGFVVRLDPKHSYLPVSGEYEETNDHQYRVEDFFEVESGFWFPQRGSIQMNVEGDRLFSSWEITSVELNQEYPAELFVPPMGDGTRVINAITGKQYWHGGKAPAPKESSQAQPKPRTSNPDPASATPETPFDWSWWLVGFGVVCVGLAIWIRR